MNDDIIELQTKMSFQDDLLAELNQVVTDQQQQVSRLELAVETLKVQVQTMQTANQEPGQQHEVPPHY